MQHLQRTGGVGRGAEKKYSSIFLLLRTCNWRLTTALARLVDAEIQAGNRSGDYVFLDLNQVAVGVGHGQHREHVLAARNDYQLARPVVLVCSAPGLKLHRG